MDTQLVVLLTALVVGCAGTDAGYRRSCTETDLPRVSLPLDCPLGHVIHVLQWLTAISAKGAVSQCQFHPDCAKSADSDLDEYFLYCNGRRSCREDLDLKGNNFCVNGTKLRYVQLEYECIPETSVLNICDQTSASASSFNSSSLYVRTPAFPGQYGGVINQSCSCAVRGEGLTVKMLSLSLTGRGGAIAIANHSAVVWRLATTAQQWNRNVPGLQGPGTRYVNITFNDNGISEEEAWLQISGSERNVSVLCGRGDNLVETTQTFTLWTSSPSSTSPSTSQRPSTPPTTSPLPSTPPPTSPLPSTPPKTSPRPSTPPTNSSLPSTPPPTSPLPSQPVPVYTSAPSVGDGVAVPILASLCSLLFAVLVVSLVFNFRGRLCRGRDPTYAMTEAPVSEDAGDYTELRIYEDIAAASTNHI